MLLSIPFLNGRDRSKAIACLGLLTLLAFLHLTAASTASASGKDRIPLRQVIEKATKGQVSDSAARWATERLVFAVSANWARLGDSDRASARRLLSRPTLKRKGSRRTLDIGYRAKEAKPYATEHFFIHYVLKSADAPIRVDENGNGVRDYVEQVGAEAERSWDKEIAERSWPAPPSDGNMGGDGRYDIYLGDLTTYGAYGATVPNKMPSSKETFILVDNDLPEDDTFGVSTEDALRQTLTHEFFHAIQLAMNPYMIEYGSLAWLAESSATWMETTLSENDKLATAALEFLYASLPFSIISDVASFIGPTYYGGWAYWKRMADAHGEDSIKSVFSRLGKRGEGVGHGKDRFGTETIDRVLKLRGDSIGNLFSGFALDAYLADANHFGADVELLMDSPRVIRANRPKRFTLKDERHKNGRFVTVNRERLPGLSTRHYILMTDQPGTLSIRMSWTGPRPRAYLVLGGMRGVVYKAPPSKRSTTTVTVRVEPWVLQRVAVIVSSVSRKTSWVHGTARLSVK